MAGIRHGIIITPPKMAWIGKDTLIDMLILVCGNQGYFISMSMSKSKSNLIQM